MKGKLVAAANNGNGGKGNQTDFLVCFPSRAHLALMPKAICSPSRPPDLLHKRQHIHHPHHTTTSSSSAATTTAITTTKRTPVSSRGRSSPLFKTKTRNDAHAHAHAPPTEEPTSPKVTCAGQIKVRPTKPRSSNASSRPSTDSKNWVSVMEEIERIRKDGKRKSGNSWWEAIGIKKDALQIFSSFHALRFNMACFGSFSGSTDCTSDEEEEDELGSLAREEEPSASQDVFSKWFMLIEKNHDDNIDIHLKEEVALGDEEEEEEESEEKDDSAVPPPNALLLMRCRSAPAKGLLNRAELLETEEDRIANKAKEEEKEKEKLLVMRCAPDFFKVSMDIAKETWVVGGELDILARSRSCRK